MAQDPPNSKFEYSSICYRRETYWQQLIQSGKMQNISVTNTSHSNIFRPEPVILPSQASGIAFCVAFFCVLTFIVVGNGANIVLFAFNKTLRKRALLLVINLAISDFLLGTVSLPLFITYFVGNYYQLWLVQFRDLPTATFYIFVDLALLQASFLSVVFISCERLYAIYFPFKHRTLSSRAYCLVILTVWILALLIAAIGTILSRLVSYRATVIFWVCAALTQILVICGCSIGIWRKFQNEDVTVHQRNRAVQNKRLTKVLLFVSFVELLTWLPLVALDCVILSGVDPTYVDYGTFQFIANILNYSGSFINPVVYALRIPEFRKALSSCCTSRGSIFSMKRNEKRRTTSTLTPTTKSGTSQSYPSRPQVASQEFGFDTRL